MKILLVDDDPDVRLVIARYLSLCGYDVVECGDGETALQLAQAECPTLIILDIEMPRLDGWDTLDRLRRQGCQTPVLMLTRRADVSAKVRGLQSGADDYITKPCNLDELGARIQAVLRRATKAAVPQPRLRIGLAIIDLERKSAAIEDTPLHLTRKEYAMLELLAQHHGKPVAREVILRVVWGLETEQYTHTLDTHVWRLRRKLRDNSAAPRAIRNYAGFGFGLFCEIEQSPAPASSEDAEIELLRG